MAKRKKVTFSAETEGTVKPLTRHQGQVVADVPEIPQLDVDSIVQNPEMTTIYVVFPVSQKYFPEPADKENYVRKALSGGRLDKTEKSFNDPRAIPYFTDPEEAEIDAEMRVEETKMKASKQQVKPADVVIAKIQVPAAVLTNSSIVNVDVTAQIAKNPNLFKIDEIQTYDKLLANFPEKTFEECFNQIVQYANNLTDPEFNRVFNELQSGEKYTDSNREIPKMGDAFAIAYPYRPPGSNNDNRDQLVIDTITEYTQSPHKLAEPLTAGNAIQLINFMRTCHDKITESVKKYETDPENREIYEDVINQNIQTYNGALNEFEIAVTKLNQPDFVNMVDKFKKIREQDIAKIPAKISKPEPTVEKIEPEPTAKKSRVDQIKEVSIAAKKSLNKKVEKINQKVTHKARTLKRKLTTNAPKFKKKLIDQAKKRKKQVTKDAKTLYKQIANSLEKFNKKSANANKQTSKPTEEQSVQEERHAYLTTFTPLVFGKADFNLAQRENNDLIKIRALGQQELGNIVNRLIAKHESEFNDKDMALINALYKQLNHIDASNVTYDDQGNNKHSRMCQAIMQMYHEAKNTNCTGAAKATQDILTTLKVPVPQTLNDILNSNIKALYTDKRVQAEPVKLAMYGIVKNAAKLVNQKDNLRQQQINNIQNLFNQLKAAPLEEHLVKGSPQVEAKAMIAYAYLNKIIDDIKGENNKVNSGMQQLCVELQRDIVKQFPNIEKNAQQKSDHYIETAKALIQQATPVEPKRQTQAPKT